MIEFRTSPEQYNHWRIDVDALMATLSMDVGETAGLVPGCELAAATDYLLLVDDGNAAVSLPGVPLLAVLPGTGVR